MDFGLTEIRVALHILSVTVWVGGQIVMLALLPVLRQVGGDAPRQAAQAFGRVAWPFFGLAVVTGIWNMLSVDVGAVSTSWHITFGVKFMLVIASGAAAFVHQRTDSRSMKAMTGGLGFLFSLIALILGVTLSH